VLGFCGIARDLAYAFSVAFTSKMIHGAVTEEWRRKQPFMNPNEIYKFTNLQTNLQSQPSELLLGNCYPLPYNKARPKWFSADLRFLGQYAVNSITN